MKYIAYFILFTAAYHIWREMMILRQKYLLRLDMTRTDGYHETIRGRCYVK